MQMLFTTQRNVYFINILFSIAEIYEYALQPEHIGSTDPKIFNTTITDTGALSASSGFRTGRSPKDKRIVEDEITKDVTYMQPYFYRPSGGVK